MTMPDPRDAVRALRVAFLGIGTMAEAILAGSLREGLDPTGVTVTAHSTSRVREISERYGVEGRAAQDDEDDGFTANGHAVEGADLVVIGVEPDVVPEVLAQIAGALPEQAVVASVAGGVSTQDLEAGLQSGAAVVRVMPNTASAVGRGMAALSAGAGCPQAALERVRAFFALTGEVVIVPEDQQSAVGAVSGSGPAHVFYVADAMIEAAVTLGLPRPLARRLVVQTIVGAGGLLAETGEHPVVLREQVSSPGGSTLQALADLDDRAVRAAFVAAITGRHR